MLYDREVFQNDRIPLMIGKYCKVYKEGMRIMDEQRPRRRRMEAHGNNEPSDSKKYDSNKLQTPDNSQRIQTQAFHQQRTSHPRKRNNYVSILIAFVVIEALLIVAIACIVSLYSINGWMGNGFSGVIVGAVSTPTPIPSPTPTSNPTPTPSPVIEYIYITAEPLSLPTPEIQYIYITPTPTNTPVPTPISTPVIEYIYITPSPTPIPEHIVISERFDLLESEPCFFGQNWFKLTLAPIEEVLFATGYSASSVNDIGKSVGVAIYNNGMKQPKQIMIVFDTTSEVPNVISYLYSADKELCGAVYEGLNDNLGEGVYLEARKESQTNYAILIGDSIVWKDDKYQYKINGEGAYTPSSSPTLDKLKNGEEPFVLTVSDMKFSDDSLGKATNLLDSLLNGTFTVDSLSEEKDSAKSNTLVMVQSAGLRTEPRTTLSAIRIVQAGEIVTVLESCDENQQSWYKIRCANGDIGYVLQRTVKSDNSASTPLSATPQPKTVSSAAAPVELNLRIESVIIKQNSIGLPELYARFTNTGSSSIDRFDFLVECYDRYGDVIKSHGVYDYSSCYFEDSILAPNASSPKDYYWTLYGCNGTVSVKIAITKYHTTNGQTFEIPEDQYRWKKF